MSLYPLKFNPIMKDRLWGGDKLQRIFNKPSKTETTGESWEISGVNNDVSIVSNGNLKGTSLTKLISNYKDQLLGKSVMERFGREFPILIKFIDAKKDLSIQLHPNDELAQKRHNSFGKTEMWYIMDADPEANLIVGFNKNVEQKVYKESIENNSLLELLNYEKVKEGDTFFINTGKIHAIGAGVLLAEIQQTSDITYRVYDFNRKDKDGNLRDLHTDLAIDAIDYEQKDDFKVAYQPLKNKTNTLVDCPYFKTNILDLNKSLKKDITDIDSFIIYMCVFGTATVENEFGITTIEKGETILISASSNTIEINTKRAKLLEVSI